MAIPPTAATTKNITINNNNKKKNDWANILPILRYSVLHFPPFPQQPVHY